MFNYTMAMYYFYRVPSTTFRHPPSKAEQSRNQANKTERSKKQEDGPVCCCPPPEVRAMYNMP